MVTGFVNWPLELWLTQMTSQLALFSERRCDKITTLKMLIDDWQNTLPKSTGWLFLNGFPKLREIFPVRNRATWF